jgi:hypothetical protein
MVAACALTGTAATAAPPCDFKGISVGDHASPEQIMKNFGIGKYKKNVEVSQTPAERDAAFNADIERAKTVGLMNVSEEKEWKAGPACDATSCRIPYGVTVGNRPYPVLVGLFVDFDQTGKVNAIDVSYSKDDWDEVLALMNKKYGDNWNKEENQDVTTNYETKESHLDNIIVLTHRTNGTNTRTGDDCTITVVSRDMVFLHTTPPTYRAVLEIKLVSKNF